MNRQQDEGGTTAHPEDDALLRAARERAETVEPGVAERLGQMRRAAVAELDARGARRAGWPRTAVFWSGGVAATVAAVALTFALLLPGATEPEASLLFVADADEFEAIADLEVLEELEFLAWLELEQLDAGQG
ncbi:MAG: hypothetical protein R3E82_16015 [Pseudomonadales bacterium]|nr:hypothetical protein [Pseudomonadales bacterium]